MRATTVTRCPSGSIRVYKFDESGYWGHPAEFPWHFGHCTKCNVVTWPWVTRWLSPKGRWGSVVLWRWSGKVENWLYDRGWKS